MSWLQRLRDGLAKSSRRLTTGIAEVFTRRRLDDQALEALEDLLVTADLGVATAGRLTAALAKDRFDKEVDGDEVRAVLADQIAEILAPAARPLTVAPDCRPHVILFVGVNGSGKTTTIGKFAQKFHDEGRRDIRSPPATLFAPPRSSSCKSGATVSASTGDRRRATADAAADLKRSPRPARRRWLHPTPLGGCKTSSN